MKATAAALDGLFFVDTVPGPRPTSRKAEANTAGFAGAAQSQPVAEAPLPRGGQKSAFHFQRACLAVKAGHPEAEALPAKVFQRQSGAVHLHKRRHQGFILRAPQIDEALASHI